ncbi:MAG: hypothetical protein K8R67_03800 [Desulfobacteraceae bacterium]|nr:hypothetical protein [Desulfobacteraceae bacterium]
MGKDGIRSRFRHQRSLGGVKAHERKKESEENLREPIFPKSIAPLVFDLL